MFSQSFNECAADVNGCSLMTWRHRSQLFYGVLTDYQSYLSLKHSHDFQYDVRFSAVPLQKVAALLIH